MDEHISLQLDETPIPSFQFITAFTKDVLGTYFIENHIWKNPKDTALMGRTYFYDRRNKPCAVNDKTLRNITKLYRKISFEETTYDLDFFSRQFTTSIKNNFGINMDYLMFFDDDTDSLRNNKIQMLNQFTYVLLSLVANRESLHAWEIDRWRDNGGINKMASFLLEAAEGTYTEYVFRNIQNTYPEQLLPKPGILGRPKR